MRGVRFTSIYCVHSCCIDESRSLFHKWLLISKETYTRDDARVSIRLYLLKAFMFQSIHVSLMSYRVSFWKMTATLWYQKRRAQETMLGARFTSNYFYAFTFIHLSIYMYQSLNILCQTIKRDVYRRPQCEGFEFHINWLWAFVFQARKKERKKKKRAVKGSLMSHGFSGSFHKGLLVSKETCVHKRWCEGFDSPPFILSIHVSSKKEGKNDEQECSQKLHLSVSFHKWLWLSKEACARDVHNYQKRPT